MSDIRVKEAAMWRIWYRLKERGTVTEYSLMANCGIQSDVFDEAIQGLADMGQIEQTTKNGNKSYLLHDKEPRIMQVIPTINNTELKQ